MFSYKLSPKQPLIFRDGKPFGTDDNMADTLLFPLPSTIAGAMRTAWAETNEKDYKKSLKKSVIGPFLTCTDTETNTSQLLFPAPADAVCLKPKDKPESYIYRLTPQKIKENEGVNLPSEKLKPVFMIQDIKGKPAKDSPKFWHQDKLTAWLLDDTSDQLTAKDQGVQNLPIETRTHVSIKPKEQTAKQGHLFQTAGLDFGRARHLEPEGNEKKQWGWENKEFGLACQFSGEIPETLRTIGGESRLGHIKKQDGLIPECPIDLSVAINKNRAFRLMLVTPAIFEKGYIPDFIGEETMQGTYHEVKLKLHAVAVNRWQAGTSWDMAIAASKKGKGMRSLKRLVPAGTVYWFEFLESENINVESFWLTSIAGERVRDGYGITLPGVWNIPVNIKQKG